MLEHTEWKGRYASFRRVRPFCSSDGDHFLLRIVLQMRRLFFEADSRSLFVEFFLQPIYDGAIALLDDAVFSCILSLEAPESAPVSASKFPLTRAYLKDRSLCSAPE